MTVAVAPRSGVAPGGLAPDPAVPDRDQLLDGASAAAQLAGHLGRPVERCEPVRARYQVGRSLRVLYRVRIGGATRFVALRTRPAGAVVTVFPDDRKVAGLRALIDRSGPGGLVAYAPEKGATARLADPDGRTVAFAKAYAGDEGARTLAVHDALHAPAARAGLRLPQALAYAAADRILVCEAIAGRPLAEVAGAARADATYRLGRALALLHGLPAPDAAPRFDRLDAARLGEAADTIARARPACAAAAHALLDRLAALAPAAGPTVSLHGDVHPKNAIVTHDAVALIDLDQVAAGPAAADVGSLLAALHYAALLGHAAPAEAEALLAGYAGQRPLPNPATLRWHVVAALLGERAVRTVTRVRHDGLARLPELLAGAGALLERRP